MRSGRIVAEINLRLRNAIVLVLSLLPLLGCSSSPVSPTDFAKQHRIQSPRFNSILVLDGGSVELPVDNESNITGLSVRLSSHINLQDRRRPLHMLHIRMQRDRGAAYRNVQIGDDNARASVMYARMSTKTCSRCPKEEAIGVIVPDGALTAGNPFTVTLSTPNGRAAAFSVPVNYVHAYADLVRDQSGSSWLRHNEAGARANPR